MDDIVIYHRQELRNFWSSISIEDKWCLTAMTTSELSDHIAESESWESLRAALDSYSKYEWEEDVLEISDDCVTIADDMCEEKGMHDMLEAMLEAVELSITEQRVAGSLSDDEWERIGRQILENLVLAVFARKIAAQYLLKKEESRAQQVALELELEIMQEEQQHQRAADKKKRKGSKKKKKRTKKGGKDDKDDESSDEEVAAVATASATQTPATSTSTASATTTTSTATTATTTSSTISTTTTATAPSTTNATATTAVAADKKSLPRSNSHSGVLSQHGSLKPSGAVAKQATVAEAPVVPQARL